MLLWSVGRLAVVQWETRCKKVWRVQWWRWRSTPLPIFAPGRRCQNSGQTAAMWMFRWGALVDFLQDHCPAGESDGESLRTERGASLGISGQWAPGHLDTWTPGATLATLSCAIAETPKGLSVEPLCGAPCRCGGQLRVTYQVFACAQGRSQI